MKKLRVKSYMTSLRSIASNSQIMQEIEYMKRSRKEWKLNHVIKR